MDMQQHGVADKRKDGLRSLERIWRATILCKKKYSLEIAKEQNHWIMVRLFVGSSLAKYVTFSEKVSIFEEFLLASQAIFWGRWCETHY